jgi:hypothetical protein
MGQKWGGAGFVLLILAGSATGALLLPFSKCVNCAGSGRAEFDVDQAWIAESGDSPIVEPDPGWTTPCSRCRGRGRVTLLDRRPLPQALLKPPSLRTGEVMLLFQERSTEKERAAFVQLRPSESMRATEMMLFRLTPDELFKVGVTQSGSSTDWAVFWSDDSQKTAAAVDRALQPVGIGAGASMGHGRAGWYVEREEFFAARRALLGSPEIRALGHHVVTPQVRME